MRKKFDSFFILVWLFILFWMILFWTGVIWGYLKRRLAAKGGIRQERLPLYLAEYVWHYNHRNDTIETQKKLIMKQLEKLRI